MSDVNMQQLLTRLTRLEDQVSRLVSRDTPDFEEWTPWTPTLIGATSAGTYTYDIREGWYYRIDDLVFLLCRFRVSAVTVAGTGNARVTGLPYANTGDVVATLALSSNANLTAGYSELTGEVPLNLQVISMVEEGDDVRQAYNVANIVANDLFVVNGYYKANV